MNKHGRSPEVQSPHLMAGEGLLPLAAGALEPSPPNFYL